MSQARSYLIITEVAAEGYSRALSPLVLTEPLVAGYSAVRQNLAINEPVIGGYSAARVDLLLIETLQPVEPEEIMVTVILPGFGNSAADPSIPEAANPASGATPGVTFPIHKRPQFNTRVSESMAFTSIRSRLVPWPRWNFEVPYEFLEDRSGASSSFRTLVGFWLARGGKADPFLFKDPDDYLVVNGAIDTADGVTLQYYWSRAIGEFAEPIGQVDTANTINVYFAIDEADTVPGSGPYTVAVAHAAAFVADEGVKIAGVPLTKVTGAPASGQYAVTAGVYTFNAAQNGASVVISYRYLVDPADYSVFMPNKLLFGVAPADLTRISADFQFFFTCYFEDDVSDYTKFQHMLWELGSLPFHSELLA